MNLCSHRKLLANGRAALLAAIEIYNKPQISYRDECFVILLLNAWELTLKACIAKNGKSIFYKKKRGQPYRTYSLTDALTKAGPDLPSAISIQALRMNLDLLSTYRDNAVHFYNARRFGSIIYALAQTSIMNLKDLLDQVFDVDLADSITWQLLPLGLAHPIDPIDYISGKVDTPRQSGAVRQFLAEIAKCTQVLEAAGQDTGRLLTVFKVKFESTKKIANADIVAGVMAPADGTKGPLVVTKNVDPNLTHPLKTKALIEAVGQLHGVLLTTNTFYAIVWKYGMKEKPMFCWRSIEGELVKYSQEAVTFVKRLTEGDIDLAKSEYRDRKRKKNATAPVTATLFEPDGQSIAS